MNNTCNEQARAAPEHIETIIRVATQVAPKYVFGYNSVEDLIQEGITYGLEALPRWDRERPLENFMRVHIRNRLHNYKRNKYFRYEKNADATKSEKWAERNKRRQSLMCPLEIKDEIMMMDHTLEEANYNELINLIKKELPAELRTDFLRMVDGVPISTLRRNKIQSIVRSMIDINAINVGEESAE